MEFMGNNNSGPVGPPSAGSVGGAGAGAGAGANAVNPNDVKLVDVPITDENVALNVMVSFLNLAHRRGVFAMDESAKIFECVKRFQKQ
jgi:hypothetical protein